MERISSLQNPLIKQLKKLHTPAGRREQGLFLIEGIKLCREALANGVKIRYCFVSEDTQAIVLAEHCANAECYSVTTSVLEKLSTAKTPQGALMVAEIPQREATEITGRLVLALDGISDPANLGSMLRTAEAFGVTDILCSDQTVDLYSTKVLRGAMGSSFRVRIHRGNLAVRLVELQKDGYEICATALSDESVLLHKMEFSPKTVIVIGNEGNGVSEEILRLANKTVLIPMAGQNESLNAAAAAAVVLWQGYQGRDYE